MLVFIEQHDDVVPITWRKSCVGRSRRHGRGSTGDLGGRGGNLMRQFS